MHRRNLYSGSKKKLVLAFDVGTTYSGISYCILDPGQVPEIYGVTRYPGQIQVGNCKVPTIIYYNKSGGVEAVGADAVRDGIQDEAKEKGWTKAEWFKLHLRPKTTSSADVTEKIPSLPKGKTAIQVFADFLHYLYRCARTYIEESAPHGADLLNMLEPQAEFVLSHPNGWEGGQQGLMRQAAVKAGLIPDTEEGRSRVFFVTEGEASLHYCIQKGLTDFLKNGKGVLIVDAGGGTIDISTYKRTSPSSPSFEEIATPLCAFKGSIFVNRNFREYLETLPKNPEFELDLDRIAETFDQKTKLSFVKPNQVYVIRCGRFKDNYPDLTVKYGQLQIPGSKMEDFFRPSATAIIKMIRDQLCGCSPKGQCKTSKDQCKTSKTEISSVFLVGGFAASDWLFNTLKEEFIPGLDVCRPDGHTNKVVADGAVSYHIDHFVKARVAKYSYGTSADRPFVLSNEEHSSRMHSLTTNLAGYPQIRFFSVILAKHTNISEDQEFRQSYIARFSSSLHTLKRPVICFRGLRTDPRWFDEEEKLYSTLCYIEADISHVQKSIKHSLLTGSTFHEIEVDIIFCLGLTEFKAHIAWKENNVEKRSPAQLVYDPDAVIQDDTPII